VIQSDGVSTTVTFSCGEGFTLNGPSTAECLQDGTWNVSQPQCGREKCYQCLHETDIVNTKEIILPICDKQYHMNKRKVKKGKKIKVLQNYAFYKQD